MRNNVTSIKINRSKQVRKNTRYITVKLNLKKINRMKQQNNKIGAGLFLCNLSKFYLKNKQTNKTGSCRDSSGSAPFSLNIPAFFYSNTFSTHFLQVRICSVLLIFSSDVSVTSHLFCTAYIF